MPDPTPEISRPDSDSDDFELDAVQQRLNDDEALASQSRPLPTYSGRPSKLPEQDPLEDFWASFAMITHTGERFMINVCFRNRQHYNAEMHKFETAKNQHVTLRDASDEAVVIKRDLLLYVLPEAYDEIPNRKW
ncbi:MAG: hypothetical protein ACOYL5_18580 [Phototrophicaceae bacterium]